jgi:hypothetical protein
VDAVGPYEGEEGELIELVGTGVDVAADELRYEWDVDGDGLYESVEERVEVRWDVAGEYEVALRVTDGDGGEGLDTAEVQIGNGPPVAEAGGPYIGYEGSPIELRGSGSDPTGDPLTYRWDLDNDGSFETPGAVVTHTWGDNGEYRVTLRVADGRGGVDTDEATVTVNNVPPAPDAGPDQTVYAGEPVSFRGQVVDPGADTYTYEWDFDYDGTIFDVDDTGARVTTSFPLGRPTYQVALRVTDDDGGAGLDTALVSVLVPPLTVEAGGPYAGVEGVPIRLSGSGSPEPLIYTWDLDGDGVPETSGQEVTRAWPDDGVYEVTLRVEDVLGRVATDNATVVVDNVPPRADAGGPYTTTVGIPLTLVVTATDVPADPLAYAWDLDGDGLFDDGVQRVVTYTWTATGMYTVTVRVDDGDTGVTTDTTTVTVNSLYPVAWLGAPYLLALRKKLVRSKQRTRRSGL